MRLPHLSGEQFVLWVVMSIAAWYLIIRPLNRWVRRRKRALLWVLLLSAVMTVAFVGLQ